MNPGMVVKLRPDSPWRIGPDSGARNRVDSVYHSDSLYAAVTSAMAVLGSREEWLDATARAASPAVCFSSCFPFVDEIGFVAPPRTVWPPAAPGVSAARVRWKSARFVPLGIVQAVLAGERLDDGQWIVDGQSACLLPVGRLGPFRTGVRWNAAIDRLTGSAERHSTACLEFRPGAGLWTIVSFADDAARDRWSGPVKAAFRWLADSGFGGERSRGWGRSEAPEFIEGALPEMILGTPTAEASVIAPPPENPPATETGPDPAPETPDSAAPAASASEPETTETTAPAAEPPTPESAVPATEPSPATDAEPASFPTPESADAAAESVPPPAASGAEPHQQPAPAPEPATDPGPPASSPRLYWLLSLYTPAPADAVDWERGNYTLMTRGGRVDTSGELKKQLPMVAEGSVIAAASELRGSAPDVAPDGHAHPVFRAGFAVSIPLPEASQ